MKAQTKPDLLKLTEQKLLLEQRREIKAYLLWLSLSDEIRKKAYEEWDKYYEEVRRSPIAELFREQKEAAKKGNWLRVKDLAKQSKEMRLNGDLQTIDKPRYPEPEKFYHDQLVLNYRSLIEDIARLKMETPSDDF